MEAHAAFNTLDYIVLGIILLSGVLAVFNGFVREIYSLFTWLASAYIGLHFYRLATPFLKHYMSNPTTLMYVAIFAVFCICFLLMSLIGMFITPLIRGGALTAIDRSLGFAFGLLRGVFLVSLLYLTLTMIFWPDIDKAADSQDALQTETIARDEPVKTEDGKRHLSFAAPHWLMDARTRPMLAHGADLLRDFIPEKVLEKTTKEYLEKKEEVHEKIDEEISKLPAKE